MLIYNSDAQWKKGLSLLKAQAGRFDATLHLVAYNALLHVQNTGDIRRLNAILPVIPLRAREALRVWATKFGKVRWDAEHESFAYAKTAVGDMSSAEAVSPMQFKPEKKEADPQAFALLVELQKLVKRAEKKGAGKGQLYEHLSKLVATAAA